MTDPLSTRYAVGWADQEWLAAVELFNRLFPGSPLDGDGMLKFGKGSACIFGTPEEAQGFLDYVCRINSESNLKAINGIGAQGFVVIQVTCKYPDSPDPWSKALVISKYGP